MRYVRRSYGKAYTAGDGEGTNAQDTKALCSDDTNFIVNSPDRYKTKVATQGLRRLRGQS
jgi:hypothetical protein